MHDVVAHHMSLIAVRAETAPYRVGDEPEARASEFAAIATASRAALGDMRRLLGVLRSDPDAPSAVPSPGLAGVPALVEAAGAAGLDVALEAGAVRADPVVEECAYRVVQEAISNATRHAPGASVRVAVGADGGERPSRGRRRRGGRRDGPPDAAQRRGLPSAQAPVRRGAAARAGRAGPAARAHVRRREPHPDDRRRQIVTATDQAREALLRELRPLADDVGAVAAGLSPEQRRLVTGALLDLARLHRRRAR